MSTNTKRYLAALGLSTIMLAPVSGQAASLPVNTAAEPASDINLVRDGEESRYWNSYPGAAIDIPSGLGDRFDLHLGAPRGFALQAPRARGFPLVAPGEFRGGFSGRHVPSGGKM